MRTRGRPILGAISGFFLGLFVGLDLLLFSVVQLDSVLLTILPIVGLVLGFVLSLWAPLGRGRLAPPAPAPTPVAATAPASAPSAPADEPPAPDAPSDTA